MFEFEYYSMGTEIVAIIVAGVWLLGLTAVLFLQIKFFNRLTKGTKKGELGKILDEILVLQDINKKDLRSVKKEIARLEGEGKLHVQKVGLIRFNPFEEIGGDHSFSVAILDANDTGVVLTGLHTRDRTRVYAKSIEKGKTGAELSKEEQEALEKARRNQ